MKATIEFGYNRVIVPFQADQTVSQLMTQASERYKKLLARPCRVHKLETRDGALLCGDDLLKDVIDDKEILVAVFDDFDEEEDTLEDFNSMTKKPPYNHPRLAGDASLGLSPIHQSHQKRIQDEPATSSPMTSLLENNFQRGGKNRSTTSRLSSDIDYDRNQENDEGFYSDAQKDIYFQQSDLIHLRGSTGENGLGVSLEDWRGSDDRILGLRIESIQPGSISDLNEYFDQGDGILEIDSVSLNSGTLSNRCNLFNTATQRKKFTVRLVQRHKIEEIESIDNSTISDRDCKFETVQSVIKSNSRQVGEIKFIDITKARSGLGFTIASRDISSAGDSPIIINRITPNGAAALTDLRIGDRLLSINRDEIVSKSQAEVVSKLKSYEVGSTVTVKVSRWVEPAAVTYDEMLEITIPLQKNEILGLELRNPNTNEYTGLFIEKILQNSAAQKDGRLMVSDQILSINRVDLIGLKLSDALSIVRQTLSPDIVKQKGAVELKIGRSNPKKLIENHSKPLLPSKAPAPIPKKTPNYESSRHNDSYIMATQSGVKKIPLDSKINRSQSLKALQYIIGQDDSVVYKDYPLDDAEEPIGFDRESSSRQSFSEKRKQASMSPPMTEKLIEYRSLNRKKTHGNFIELTI